MSRYIVWVDDQLDIADTLKYASQHFSAEAARQGVELVLCGGEAGSPHDRGHRCLSRFREFVEQPDKEILGFILDVKVPGGLGVLGDQFSEVKTGGGSEAGYQIGRLFLRNAAESIDSPIGERHVSTPIFFLSVSDRCVSNFSSWTFSDVAVEYQKKGEDIHTQLSRWLSALVNNNA